MHTNAISFSHRCNVICARDITCNYGSNLQHIEPLCLLVSWDFMVWCMEWFLRHLC